ncbi:metallophosphoesterase [Vibrio barjaei]|uniref:metallophosphoesterase n=1 Tax=Vibrio barjaei TaxID=1676683 RepID=UPI0022839FC3|nr:metallophosphoesterase [Vibrio barjaei]MCY9873851.1 metallophosphoesterase [Vibrio barjaei]
MGDTYYMADPHDGHRAIGTYRGPITNGRVKCVETNRQFIRENWRAKKRDVVYIVGDAAFARDSHEFFNSLPGTKILLLGNHDLETTKRSNLNQLTHAFTKIYGVVKKRIHALNSKVWVQHIPMKEQDLRGCYQIHGHIHDERLDYMNRDQETFDDRYINVNMDALWTRTGKIMLSISELEEYRSTHWLTKRHVTPSHYQPVTPVKRLQYTPLQEGDADVEIVLNQESLLSLAAVAHNRLSSGLSKTSLSKFTLDRNEDLTYQTLAQKVGDCILNEILIDALKAKIQDER